jgi:hypothetical protein
MSQYEDTPPTVAERYTRAISSSHLRAEDGRCDLDYLIAAGWLEDGLGALLYRLRSEYDTARAVIDGTCGDSIPHRRLAAMQHLRSLAKAREALGSFAVILATQTGFMRPDREALILAGQVLEVWLDPLCHHCEGRGFNGGGHRGEQKHICRPCHGTGYRRGQVGRGAEQQAFASRLELEMAQRLTHVERQIRQYLNGSSATLTQGLRTQAVV